MSNDNSVIPFSEFDDDRPIPFIVADKWNFSLTYIEGEYGFLYSVRDWVAGLVGEENVNQTLKNMRRTSELVFSKHQLPYKASNEKTYQMEFTDEDGLYQIAQYLRVTKERASLREIKDYLVKAGVFVDKIRRNPDEGIETLEDHKEYKRLIASGFSRVEARQWIQRREKGIATRKEITAVWAERGAKGRDYADLTNQATEVAIGKTATQLRRELTIKRNDSLRPYLSTMELTELDITETLAKGLHIERDSQGKPELSEDIGDVRPIMDAARPEIEKAFSKKRPRRQQTLL